MEACNLPVEEKDGYIYPVWMYISYIQARFLLQLAIPPIMAGWLPQRIPDVASRQECANTCMSCTYPSVPTSWRHRCTTQQLEPRKGPIAREDNLACKLHMTEPRSLVPGRGCGEGNACRPGIPSLVRRCNMQVISYVSIRITDVYACSPGHDSGL